MQTRVPALEADSLQSVAFMGVRLQACVGELLRFSDRPFVCPVTHISAGTRCMDAALWPLHGRGERGCAAHAWPVGAGAQAGIFVNCQTN